jgi:NADH-quinone oxidoreductase subunit F
MPRLESVGDLHVLTDQAEHDLQRRGGAGTRIVVGMGTCGIAAGARETMGAILEELERHQLDAEVATVGCIGICSREPLVDVEQVGKPRVTYANVHPEMVPRLIAQHLGEGHVVQEWTMEPIPADPSSSETPLYRKQLRVILRNCGRIDPENIEEYIAHDGYQALGKVLSSMAPEEVFEEVKLSRLRGRGVPAS